MVSDVVLRIPTPSYFSFQECIWFLNRNYDDCLHVVSDRWIRKAIMVDGQPVLFEISSTVRDLLEVRVLSGESSAETFDFLEAYIREWFDLARDVTPFYELLGRDAVLDYMAESFFGLRLVGIMDLYEALCWSIIGQQINLTFAYRLKRRLVEQYGLSLEHDGEVYHIFPDSQVLAAASVEDMRAMQFSQKKAEYLIGIASAFASGRLSKTLIESLPDFTTKQQLLTSIKGIGVWTANYALMKSLREPQGIPHGDVGLLNALERHCVIASRSEKEKIESFFRAYAGWESYVVLYLWRSLAVK